MDEILIIIIIIIILLFFIYKINESFYPITFNSETFENDYVLPKVVYGFWDDYDENKIIQSHVKTWEKKLSSDWKIIILNKDNVYKYVSSDFITKYGSGSLDPTRFSDFLRVDLLKNNGGCWIDASIFITNSNFLNDMYNEMINYKYDACFYEYKENTISPTQPHIDNWFMMAPKNSKIISDLYFEFNRAFEMDFLKYKNNVIIPSGINIDKTLGSGDNTYLMQHAIFHYLFKKGKKYDILLKNATESMYKIQLLYDWDHGKIIDFIYKNKKWDKLYAIKLTKGNRAAIYDTDKYIQKINSL